jgi:hypothetical protein
MQLLALTIVCYIIQLCFVFKRLLYTLPLLYKRQNVETYGLEYGFLTCLLLH